YGATTVTIDNNLTVNAVNSRIGSEHESGTANLRVTGDITLVYNSTGLHTLHVTASNTGNLTTSLLGNIYLSGTGSSGIRNTGTLSLLSIGKQDGTSLIVNDGNAKTFNLNAISNAHID